jgi:hypothetical protein
MQCIESILELNQKTNEKKEIEKNLKFKSESNRLYQKSTIWTLQIAK